MALRGRDLAHAHEFRENSMTKVSYRGGNKR
jgi:hypothetical protein